MILTVLIQKHLTRLCSAHYYVPLLTAKRFFSSNMIYKVILFIVVALAKITKADPEIQINKSLQSYTEEQLMKLPLEDLIRTDKKAIVYNLVPFGKEFYHDPEGSASYQSTRYIHALLYVMRDTQTLIQTTERLYRNVRDNMNKCKPHKYVHVE